MIFTIWWPFILWTITRVLKARLSSVCLSQKLRLFIQLQIASYVTQTVGFSVDSTIIWVGLFFNYLTPQNAKDQWKRKRKFINSASYINKEERNEDCFWTARFIAGGWFKQWNFGTFERECWRFWRMTWLARTLSPKTISHCHSEAAWEDSKSRFDFILNSTLPYCTIHFLHHFNFKSLCLI
jgi:hypothetical protein